MLIITQLVCPIPSSREEDFNKVAHIHYLTYMVMPQHKNVIHGHKFYYSGRPFHGNNYYLLKFHDMELTILVDPSVVIITIYLVCLIYAWE